MIAGIFAISAAASRARTRFAYKKAIEWSKNYKEFIKRAVFSLMAYLAVYDKKAFDKEFAKFLSAIKTAATDDRNFVKKAVNWALRQIGKRSIELNRESIETAKEIQKKSILRVLNG